MNYNTKQFICLLFMAVLLIVCSCSINEEKQCEHCWLYAGMALTTGSIDDGFQRADDELDKACNEENPDFTNSCADYPGIAKISKAIMRNEFGELMYFHHPTPDDFEWCAEEGATCAVFYRRGWDFETDNNFKGDPDDKPPGHYMVYDYHTNLLYDNCNCWHGCDTFGNYEYLDLYISYRYEIIKLQ